MFRTRSTFKYIPQSNIYALRNVFNCSSRLQWRNEIRYRCAGINKQNKYQKVQSTVSSTFSWWLWRSGLQIFILLYWMIAAKNRHQLRWNNAHIWLQSHSGFLNARICADKLMLEVAVDWLCFRGWGRSWRVDVQRREVTWYSKSAPTNRRRGPSRNGISVGHYTRVINTVVSLGPSRAPIVTYNRQMCLVENSMAQFYCATTIMIPNTHRWNSMRRTTDKP